MSAKAASSRRVKPAARSEWAPPSVADADLTFNMGESVLVQFVAAHDPPAVLRELVQNEYDAGGHTLEVAFGADMLRVRGSGATIDRAGWKRLSLMLGTGLVHATGERVKEKPNGIGSKNFGLRSLFLFGDRIFVRSAGKQIFLDRLRGTPALLQDLSTRNLKGAHIAVPYREVRDGLLQPFGIEEEAKAFDALASELAPTLIKLAQPGTRNSLETIVVSSERLGRRLVWRQSVESLRTRMRGVKVFRRTIRFLDSRRGRPQVFEELEFQQVVDRPTAFVNEPVPGYFDRRGKVLIGVSVRTRKGGLDANHRGTFFYPLGIPQGFTGTAVSVNAPFQLDGDRSQLLEPKGNPWNAWLLERTVALTNLLLKEDWIDRFGAAAFHAVAVNGAASTPVFRDRALKFLQEGACWPSRKRTGNQPVFVRANHLVIPEAPELDGFLADPLRDLDERLAADPRIRSMVLNFGAMAFSLNSLVRLRCAPQANGLLTKVESGYADFHYKEFPVSMGSPLRQAQFGRALDAHSKRLSPKNWSDLKRSASTLTGAGTLAPAESLWAVPEEFLAVVDIPAEDRLHNVLLSSRVIRGIGKVFKPHDWAREVASRVRAGTARASEREALYRLIVGRGEELPRKLRLLLRETKVLKDHAGEWVCPADLIRRGAAGTELLSPVLHFPHADYAKKPELARSFRFRQRVSHVDVVAFAELVEREPERAGAFERIMRAWHKQLPNDALRELRELAWCPTSTGELLSPAETYLDTSRNRSCMGGDVPYARSRLTGPVLEQLGCRVNPDWDDVVAYLEALRESGLPLSSPEQVYPALVDALRSAGLNPAATLAERVIVWTGAEWSAPANTLVGRSYAQMFTGIIPHLPRVSAAVSEALVALGASRTPMSRHWRALLDGIACRYSGKSSVVSAADQEALLSAYERLEGALSVLGVDARVFLDREGRLHTRSAVIERRYLIDDDPAMAAAVAAAGLPIAFACAEARSLPFLQDQGVATLRAARNFVSHRIGTAKEPPLWLEVPAMLARLHDPAFVSAMGAYLSFLARKRGERGEDAGPAVARRLRAITTLQIVSELHAEYRVLRRSVLVPRRFAVEKDRLLFSGVRTKRDFVDLISRAVAQAVAGEEDGTLELADPLFRLLTCHDAQEMEQYLTDRGVPWSARSAASRAPEIDPDEEAPSSEPVQQVLGEMLAQRLNASTSTPERLSPPLITLRPVPLTAPPAQEKPLPPLEDVRPVVASTTSGWHPTPRVGGGERRPSGTWTPPSTTDVERDRALGRRGEELVLRLERARLRAAGLNESLAVWRSATDEGADHDIQSVDADGAAIWIEVKSTRGRTGRFQWAGAEFQLAMRKRSRYVLYRVYEADEAEPVVKCFRDPIGLLMTESMRIDVASLYAEVEPAGPT